MFKLVFFFLHMYLNKPAKNHLLKCTQTHSSANKFVSTYVSRYIFQGVLTLILFSLKAPSKYTLCCVMTTALPCRWSSSHMPMYFSPLGGKWDQGLLTWCMSLIQNSFNDRPSLETRTDIDYCEPTIRRNLAPSYLRRCVPHLTLLSFHISKIAVFLGLFRPCDVIVDAISCLLVVDPLPDENTGGIPRQFPRAQHAITVPLPIAETALVHLATCIPEYDTYTAAFCVSVQSPQLWPLQKKNTVETWCFILVPHLLTQDIC